MVAPKNTKRVLFAAYDEPEDASYAIYLLNRLGLQASPGTVTKDKHFVYIDDRERITVGAGRQPLLSAKSTTEYMIAVHNGANADLRSNEEFGDRRVNLYITLATAVLGGLIFLVTRQFISSLQFLFPIVFFGIAVVISIGWVTFLRILNRNKQTDQHIRVMRDIGKFFILSEPSIKPFLGEFDPFNPKTRRSKNIKLRSPGTGGLLQTVAILNSLVAASLPLIIIAALNIASGSLDGSQTTVDRWQNILPLALSAAALFGGAWWLQMNYAKDWYEEDEKKWLG